MTGLAVGTKTIEIRFEGEGEGWIGTLAPVVFITNPICLEFDTGRGHSKSRSHK